MFGHYYAKRAQPGVCCLDEVWWSILALEIVYLKSSPSCDLLKDRAAKAIFLCGHWVERKSPIFGFDYYPASDNSGDFWSRLTFSALWCLDFGVFAIWDKHRTFSKIGQVISTYPCASFLISVGINWPKISWLMNLTPSIIQCSMKSHLWSISWPHSTSS